MRTAILMTAASLALAACNSKTDTPAGEATVATADDMAAASGTAGATLPARR
mgnify:CR=1 FL=1